MDCVALRLTHTPHAGVRSPVAPPMARLERIPEAWLYADYANDGSRAPPSTSLPLRRKRSLRSLAPDC
jgi:hypothetical protein